jgi:hypothetical protein
VALARIGGMETIIGVLRRYEANAAVAKNASFALRNLFRNGALSLLAWIARTFRALSDLCMLITSRPGEQGDNQASRWCGIPWKPCRLLKSTTDRTLSWISRQGIASYNEDVQ